MIWYNSIFKNNNVFTFKHHRYQWFIFDTKILNYIVLFAVCLFHTFYFTWFYFIFKWYERRANIVIATFWSNRKTECFALRPGVLLYFSNYIRTITAKHYLQPEIATVMSDCLLAHYRHSLRRSVSHTNAFINGAWANNLGIAFVTSIHVKRDHHIYSLPWNPFNALEYPDCTLICIVSIIAQYIEWFN